MVELLAPAGSFESLRSAVNAGADAVYIGGSMFGARAYADNPDEEHLMRGIEYCHLHGRKLYLTVNTLLKETELEQTLYPFLLPFYRWGLDGIIVQDPGVVQFVREFFPDLRIHASTQMTVTSSCGARLLQRQGIRRAVLSRELSLDEVGTIIRETGIEAETFIHGAMCYCYSGQCLLSSMIGGRSGNRGRCAQPCRLPYSLPDQEKAYLLSMKDMCTLDLLPELIGAGISSFKIEGRMKRPEYTAGVVSVYRKYMDLYLEKGEERYEIDEKDRLILLDLYNRGGFSSGYYKTPGGRDMMALKRPNHQGTGAARILCVSHRTIRAKALEDLHRQDILELAPGEEITLAADVEKGASFSFHTASSKREQGGVLYRTKNQALLDGLGRAYTDKNLQEKIKGELRIFQDLPAILTVNCQGHTVTVSGAAAKPALKSPLSREDVRRQMMKTGNTPFSFEALDIDMDEGIFIPIKDLNELRRNALLALEQDILKNGRRPEPVPDRGLPGKPVTEPQRTVPVHSLAGPLPGSSGEGESENRDVPCRMNVLVTSREQLAEVLAFSCPALDTVYLDSILFGFREDLEENYKELDGLIASVKTRGLNCFLSFPPVFRSQDQALFRDKRMLELLRRMDGVLLHTLDHLGYAREYINETGRSLTLAADDSLYAWNRRAGSFLSGLGITRRTLPCELNFGELMKLDRKGGELIVYGRQPLMQSAQCLRRNTSGCNRTGGFTYLKDRKNALFPVLCRCPVCCSTVYNSVPLQLGGCKEEILRLSPGFVRLSFTVEDGRSTRQILEQYGRQLFSESTAKYSLEGTRGHFRRGVE